MPASFIGVLAILTASALQAFVSCDPPPPFCERLGDGMIVFIGYQSGPDLRSSTVTFRIDEVLWGLPPGTKTIQAFSDTYSTFVTQPRFIALPRFLNKRYAHSYCGSIILSLDDPLVASFRKELAHPKPHRLLLVPSDRNGYKFLDVEVNLSGPLEARGNSGSLGYFFASLLPGTYKVDAQKPFYQPSAPTISVPPGSCASVYLKMEPTSSVSGKLLDSKGHPVKGEEGFFLIRWDPDRDRPDLDHSHFIEVDDGGKFKVKGVEPGTYYLGTNIWDSIDLVLSQFPKTYYPGVPTRAQAQPLTIIEGRSIENLVFRLPDFGPTRRITVHVISADGLPVPGAAIHDGGADGAPNRAGVPKGLITGADGTVTFEAWQRTPYSIQATAQSPSYIPSVPVSVAPANTNTTVRIAIPDLSLKKSP